MNRIQIEIFKKLSSEKEMSGDEYVTAFSEELIDKNISMLDQLSEKEADEWIAKVYIQSLEMGQ